MTQPSVPPLAQVDEASGSSAAMPRDSHLYRQPTSLILNAQQEPHEGSSETDDVGSPARGAIEAGAGGSSDTDGSPGSSSDTDGSPASSSDTDGSPASSSDTDGSPAKRGKAALLDALSVAISGFECIDERLELDVGPRVDFVGSDGLGQLLLVLRIGGRGQSSVSATLDVVAFAQRHSEVLCRHLGTGRLRADLPTRIVILADNYESDVRRRLLALKPCGVELMELGALRSAAGERLFVLPLEGDSHAPAPTKRTGLEPAVANLPDEQRQKIRSIARRLERLDEGLEIQATRHSVSWFLETEVVARVDFPSDAPPRGLIPGRSARTLGGPHDVELFLDEVVASYVERSELAPQVEITPHGAPPDTV